MPTSDSFYAQNRTRSPQPNPVPFTLRQDDRLLLTGDSITEANRHSRMLETYHRDGYGETSTVERKGFAVVADEVRKLAERSSVATKEIAGMIRTIQSEAGEAVQAMG